MKQNLDGYKIKLVYKDLEGKIAVENVWASKEGEYYRIKNVPFFAPNIAYDDLVSVEEENGDLFYDDLIEPSGHSTLQLIIFDKVNFESVTKELIDLKCDWEGSHIETYISVDVPKNVDYSKVKNYLEEKHSQNILDYKEACLAHSN